MPTTIPQRMGTLEWGPLIALSILWGGSFFFVGVAVAELPPFSIVLLRVAIAAMALHLALRVLGVKMPWDAKAWLAFFGVGLLNNAIPFSLIVWGQTHIASGLASVLNATTPLFTVLVAHILTADERLTRARIAGVLLGLTGVVVMIGPAAMAELGRDVLAQLAVLAAALSYAFAGVFGRRFKRMGIPPLATAAGQVSASSLLMLPVALLIDRPWTIPIPMPGLTAFGAVLGLALLSTALAYYLFFRILAAAGAVNLLLVTFLIPVSAILLGCLVLGEVLRTEEMIGMALIGAGLAAIDGRLPALLRVRVAT